jgi:thiamine-monophosphate kinase
MLHMTTDFPEGMTLADGLDVCSRKPERYSCHGCRAHRLLMAIGMPSDTEIAFVEELAKGIQACAAFCGTSVIGGDLIPMPS